MNVTRAIINKCDSVRVFSIAASLAQVKTLPVSSSSQKQNLLSGSLSVNNNSCWQRSCYFKTMRPKVYVTRPDVAPVGIELLKEECDVTTWTEESPVPRDVLLRNVIGKDGIYCALTERIDAELLDHAGPNLKVVATISVGYEHIDVAECRKRGIRIGYTPDVLTDATAELTMALLLAQSRRIVESHKEVFNGGWKAWSPAFMCGHGLKGSTVGMFGFGRIGQEVAKRIVPFKPNKIIYANRSDRYEARDMGIDRVSFDQLLAQSDFIIITAALTPDTALLFDEDAFSKMKSNAIIVNTARGGIIDQVALYNALKERQIHAAALDVTTPEPLPLDSPLLTLDNCLIIPHIGSADIETRIEMSRITAANILAALKGVKMHSELE